MNEKINELGSNHKECGFPETALSRNTNNV